jgi:transcriptional regulator with XRE-family HTH domain
MIPESTKQAIIAKAKEMGYADHSGKISQVGINTTRLAKDAGLNQSTLWRFLNGKTDMGYKKLQKLYRYLGIPYL